LKKWADFSNVSLQKLIQSFEGNPIYDEGLKEVFTKDLDADGIVTALKHIAAGKVELLAINNHGQATPVARTGIERVSMKTDLIPPEKMRAVLIESAKARLLNETGTFVCTTCWSYSEAIRIAALPDNQPRCPNCSSTALGMLKVTEQKIEPIIEKKAQKLTKDEKWLHDLAEETAALIDKYGKPAAIALSARKVKTADIAQLLQKNPNPTDEFYEALLEEERKALSKRFS
jgi:ATP-dependent Lhr-like helicase